VIKPLCATLLTSSIRVSYANKTKKAEN